MKYLSKQTKQIVNNLQTTAALCAGRTQGGTPHFYNFCSMRWRWSAADPTQLIILINVSDDCGLAL